MSVTQAFRREQGQVAVFFALLLPVLFGIGAVVLDVGNWFVHKRHLQTQVDAAVLAAAPSFVGCFHGPAGANVAITNDALAYAGDVLRDPSTRNLQVQEPGDVRVVLNSSRYWRPSDGMVPGTNGYGLDNSVATPGDPCSLSSLEAKATDESAPPLWGLIPFTPSPKTEARVEIRQVLQQNNMLPIAVPEVDPRAVAAIFVNEEDGSVIAALELNELSCPVTSYPYNCWTIDFPSVELNYDNVGVVVLVSRDDPNPNLSGTLSQICSPPGDGTGVNELILCYGGEGNESGLSFIHGYSGGGAVSLQAPRIRDVQLFDIDCALTGDNSSPYFVFYGECQVGIRAVVDFGQDLGPDPTAHPKCVHVFASGAGELTYAGQAATGTGSIFEGTLTLAEASGRNRIDISWDSWRPGRPNCNNPVSGTLPKVAAPYAANENSGPVQYITLERLSAPFGLANSTEKNPAPQPVRVTVGLQQTLELQDARTPPILLRLGSNPGSQTQSLDCDEGTLVGDSGAHSNWRNEFKDGCLTIYRKNFGDWNTPPDGTKEWIDIRCTQYMSLWGNQPPDDQFNDPVPNCIAVQTGVSAGQFRDGLADRFASPCTPNNWPPTTATDAEVEAFFQDYNFLNDPRYVTLVVADFTAFQGSGSSDPRPIKVFAGFYYTGSGAVSCPDDDPHPNGVTGSRARFDMWGHYVNIVEFSGSANPDDEVCSFVSTEAGNCVAVLVE